MQTARILLVVTSCDQIGSMPEPTGLWLEEVAAPYYVFADARCDVTIASPLGGSAPIDPRSDDASTATASTRRFEADAKAQAKLQHTLKLSGLTLGHYDAVFFAGGHGTMGDFATDASVRQTVEAFAQAGKPYAFVCHGPAALVQATGRSGAPLIKGKRFTCFTDAEETSIGLHQQVPFLLERKLRELGGIAQNGPMFEPHVVSDGLLVTGQNPASSIAAAEAVIHQLRMQAAA